MTSGKGLENKIFELKIVNIFLPISLNMFWVLKRTVSLRQHMLWLKNKNITFLVLTFY